LRRGSKPKSLYRLTSLAGMIHSPLVGFWVQLIRAWRHHSLTVYAALFPLIASPKSLVVYCSGFFWRGDDTAVVAPPVRHWRIFLNTDLDRLQHLHKTRP
jgi:hypothetical protein